MRLLAAISHHGLGHLAQSAPLLDRLLALRPDIRLVIQSALPAEQLRRRITHPFEHLNRATDVGFLMQDALRLDLPASEAAYRAFHGDWSRRVEEAAAELRRLAIDRVYSNVGYLPLMAAARAGLPGAALCSINWLDMHRHYLHDTADAASIAAQMHAAYASAALFLRPEPSMPMKALANTAAIPPIAQRGRDRRVEFLARLGLAARTRLVLVGMGGIPYRTPVRRWPEMNGVAWLLPDEICAQRADLKPLSALADATFIDLLASSDALVTKPGYGSFVEATAHAVPVLYLPRDDWPETPWLATWLERHNRAMCLSEADLLAGRLEEALEAVWDMPTPSPIEATGADEAARRLAALYA